MSPARIILRSAFWCGNGLRSAFDCQSASFYAQRFGVEMGVVLHFIESHIFDQRLSSKCFSPWIVPPSPFQRFRMRSLWLRQHSCTGVTDPALHRGPRLAHQFDTDSIWPVRVRRYRPRYSALTIWWSCPHGCGKQFKYVSSDLINVHSPHRTSHHCDLT